VATRLVLDVAAIAHSFDGVTLDGGGTTLQSHESAHARSLPETVHFTDA